MKCEFYFTNLFAQTIVVVDIQHLIDSNQEYIQIIKKIEKSQEINSENLIQKEEKIKKILNDIQESKLIFKSSIKKQVNRKTKKVRYVIKESDYDEVLVELNSRMVSNIIRSLVKKGLVETAFDDDKNDFVFWVSKLGEDYHGNFETDEF